MLVAAVSVPELPVMITVSGNEWAATEVAAVKVSFCVPAAEPAAKEAVTPLGSPLADRVTALEKPPTLVTAMVLVSLPPWATETEVGEAERVKPGGRFTVTGPVPVAVE